MTWAKLDDRANEHRKQLDAGPEACWLWACGLMYANRQVARDGFIPAAVLPMLYPFTAKQLAKASAKLVEVGLWCRAGTGFQVHQFAQWNRSKEQLETEREATRNRVAKHRCNAVTNGEVTHSIASVTNALVPDPLRLHSDSTPLQTEPSERTSGTRAVSDRLDPEPEPVLTICPLNLVDIAKFHGIIRDFVVRYSVEPEQITDAVREFVSHWTIGGGMGRKEANWPRKLRSHLKHTCERLGGLKPIGEVKAIEVATQLPYHAPARRQRETGPVMPPTEVQALLAQVLAGAK